MWAALISARTDLMLSVVFVDVWNKFWFLCVNSTCLRARAAVVNVVRHRGWQKSNAHTLTASRDGSVSVRNTTYTHGAPSSRLGECECVCVCLGATGVCVWVACEQCTAHNGGFLCSRLWMMEIRFYSVSQSRGTTLAVTLVLVVFAIIPLVHFNLLLPILIHTSCIILNFSPQSIANRHIVRE